MALWVDGVMVAEDDGTDVGRLILPATDDDLILHSINLPKGSPLLALFFLLRL